MFEIDRKTNNCKLTRGDTLYLDVAAYEDEDLTILHHLVEGDKMFFRLAGAGAYIEKEIPINLETNLGLLTLVPSDTKSLDFITYKYEIELVTVLDEHFTFIANKNFKIDEELQR